jgi:hypothetical protein
MFVTTLVMVRISRHHSLPRKKCPPLVAHGPPIIYTTILSKASVFAGEQWCAVSVLMCVPVHTYGPPRTVGMRHRVMLKLSKGNVLAESPLRGFIAGNPPAAPLPPARLVFTCIFHALTHAPPPFLQVLTSSYYFGLIGISGVIRATGVRMPPPLLPFRALACVLDVSVWFGGRGRERLLWAAPFQNFTRNDACLV